MKWNDVKIIYGDKEFSMLFKLLIDSRIEEIVNSVKQDSKMRYNSIEYYPSTDTNSEVDEKDE